MKLIASITAAIVFGLAAGVRADTDPEALSANYRAAVDLGLEEFASGNYIEARARFLEAQAIAPNARMLRALGMVEYELRNYVPAMNYLQQALLSQVGPLPESERDEAELLIQRARGYLARYTVTTRPPNAEVYLDGVLLSRIADEPLWIQVGDHSLEARAVGFTKIRRALRVESPKDQTTELVLPVETAPLESSKRAEPVQAAFVAKPALDAVPATSSAWLWGSLGAVVLVSAAAIVGVLVGSRNPYEVAPPLTTQQTPKGAVIQLLSAP